MAKKKKGRIAVPYIIALIIFLIIVGGAAYMLFDYFNLGKDSGLPELSQGNTENITYEDSHTVLLVLETPDEHRSVTFAVMRSVPKEKKLVFAGIPANTLGTFDGEMRLSARYTERAEPETLLNSLSGFWTLI